MRFSLSTILLAASLIATPSAGADVIDRIMAVVGGHPITLSDVTGARQFKLIAVPAGTADANAYVLDRLIERTLVLTEVERFQPPEPAPVEITIQVDKLEKEAGSASALEKMLSVTGMTRDQLRRFIRDDLRITIYMNQRFSVTPDPQERASATAAWIADLRRRAQVTILYTRK